MVVSCIAKENIFEDNGLFGSSKNHQKASEYVLEYVEITSRSTLILNYDLCHTRCC